MKQNEKNDFVLHRPDKDDGGLVPIRKGKEHDLWVDWT